MSKHTEGEIWIPEQATNLYHIRAESKRICVISDLGHETQEDIANAERIATLWNAANGMSNEDVVKALENYEEMKLELESIQQDIESGNLTGNTRHKIAIKTLLAKLEAK